MKLNKNKKGFNNIINIILFIIIFWAIFLITYEIKNLNIIKQNLSKVAYSAATTGAACVDVSKYELTGDINDFYLNETKAKKVAQNIVDEYLNDYHINSNDITVDINVKPNQFGKPYYLEVSLTYHYKIKFLGDLNVYNITYKHISKPLLLER